MSTITPDSDGVSDCNCNGDHWILSYFTDDKALHGVFHGRKKQVTGKLLTIEYFDTETELYERAAALDIVIPDDDA